MDSGRESLHVYGRVDADESRIYRVNLGTDGYVKETENDVVGTRVHNDQRLAVVYSPDFLSAAGGFLAAKEHSPSSPTGARDNSSMTTTSPNAASATARADRLRNLGMSDAQIEEISRTRKLPEDVYIVSPIDGVNGAPPVDSGDGILGADSAHPGPGRPAPLYRANRRNQSAVLVEEKAWQWTVTGEEVTDKAMNPFYRSAVSLPRGCQDRCLVLQIQP